MVATPDDLLGRAPEQVRHLAAHVLERTRTLGLRIEQREQRSGTKDPRTTSASCQEYATIAASTMTISSVGYQHAPRRSTA